MGLYCEGSTFENTNKVRKSSDVGIKDKRGNRRGAVDHMVSNTLEDRRENGRIWWSIAKCLFGVHVFHPLSRSIWTWETFRLHEEFGSRVHVGETPEPDITDHSMLLTYGNTRANTIKQERSVNKTDRHKPNQDTTYSNKNDSTLVWQSTWKNKEKKGRKGQRE